MCRASNYNHGDCIMCISSNPIINFIVGTIFNLIYLLFPRTLASMFISTNDASYALFMEFVELMCHSFLLVAALNAFEITGSTAIQSLGNIKKQHVVIYSTNYFINSYFIIALFIVGSEYKKLSEL